jgi:hypothetical protein
VAVIDAEGNMPVIVWNDQERILQPPPIDA